VGLLHAGAEAQRQVRSIFGLVGVALKAFVTPNMFGTYSTKTNAFTGGGRGPVAHGLRWRCAGCNLLHCNWTPASAGEQRA
jgi:hypothetical protein